LLVVAVRVQTTVVAVVLVGIGLPFPVSHRAAGQVPSLPYRFQLGLIL